MQINEHTLFQLVQCHTYKKFDEYLTAPLWIKIINQYYEKIS